MDIIDFMGIIKYIGVIASRAQYFSKGIKAVF